MPGSASARLGVFPGEGAQIQAAVPDLPFRSFRGGRRTEAFKSERILPLQGKRQGRRRLIHQ